MKIKLEQNAAGRLVPSEVNGLDSVPFAGVGCHRPQGRKAAPKIVSCVDFPSRGFAARFHLRLDEFAVRFTEPLKQNGNGRAVVPSQSDDPVPEINELGFRFVLARDVGPGAGTA